jgi:hypothetical protein
MSRYTEIAYPKHAKRLAWSRLELVWALDQSRRSEPMKLLGLLCDGEGKSNEESDAILYLHDTSAQHKKSME